MPEIRVNCFAYNPERKKCLALNQLYCAYENCRFYKPVKQNKRTQDNSDN